MNKKKIRELLPILILWIIGFFYLINIPEPGSIPYFNAENDYFYYFNYRSINLLLPILLLILCLVGLFFLFRRYIAIRKKENDKKNTEFILTALSMVLMAAIVLGIGQFFLNLYKPNSYVFDESVLNIEIKRDTAEFNEAIRYFESELNTTKNLNNYLNEFSPDTVFNLQLKDFESIPTGPLGFEISNDSVRIHIVRIDTSPEMDYNYAVAYFFHGRKIRFNSYSGSTCTNFFDSFFTNPMSVDNIDFSCSLTEIEKEYHQKIQELVEVRKYASQGNMNWQIFVFENIYRSVFNSEGYYKSTSWPSRILTFLIYAVIIAVIWPMINAVISKLNLTGR